MNELQPDKYDRWWSAPKGEAHRAVSGLVEQLKSKASHKRKQDILHAKIYGNYDVSGSGRTGASAYELIRGEDGRMRYQLCTAAVDTAMAIVTANKPVPYYLTTGATWSEQRKAKRKGKLIAGQFLDLDVHALAQRCARDAMVFGTGHMTGYLDEDGKPCVERVFPCEIVVDPAEAASGTITSKHRHRMMAKERLAELYPKHAGAIRSSNGPTQQDWNDRHLTNDGMVEMVMVYESYHLASKEGGKGGKRIMCTSHVTLVNEDWPHDWFPDADMRWKDRLTGWYGCGIVEESKAAQLRINRLIKVCEKQQNIGSNSWVFVPKISGITGHEITNRPLQIIPFNPADGPPIFHKHEGTPVDLRNEISYIRDETFQQLGLNQAQMQGEKPKGLNSAVAIRAAEDIGSRRHVDNVRQYERFFVQIALMLERLNDMAAKQAKENGETYYVTSTESRGRSEVLRSVPWEDVQTKDKASVRMFPVSALGSTPQGKMESVQELISGGFLSKPYALKLLDFPDLDSAMSLELVDTDLAHWQLERIEDGERNVVPLPEQNLELTFEEARKVICQAELLEAGDDVKRELRRYRSNIEKMIKLAQPAPAQQTFLPGSPAQMPPQAPAMVGAPQGMPVAA